MVATSRSCRREAPGPRVSRSPHLQSPSWEYPRGMAHISSRVRMPPRSKSTQTWAASRRWVCSDGDIPSGPDPQGPCREDLPEGCFGVSQDLLRAWLLKDRARPQGWRGFASTTDSRLKAAESSRRERSRCQRPSKLVHGMRPLGRLVLSEQAWDSMSPLPLLGEYPRCT